MQIIYELLINDNKISGIYKLKNPGFFLNDTIGLNTFLHFDQAGFQKHLLTSCKI
jgi:hypothetical protein